jgi:septal ring factor EnvC (AmiA/AmiB activator)
MFILAQLWTYFLLAAAFGAVLAWALQHRCAPRSVAPAQDDPAARALALAAQLRERDETLQSTRAALDILQHDSSVRAQRLLAAEQEIEVLRRQVAASRSELAQVLGQRDVEADVLRAELSAAQSMLKNVASA